MSYETYRNNYLYRINLSCYNFVFLLRKFISWAIEDDDKWNKNHGRLGLHKSTKDTNKKIAYDRLTEGYLLIVGILVLIVIKTIID